MCARRWRGGGCGSWRRALDRVLNELLQLLEHAPIAARHLRLSEAPQGTGPLRQVLQIDRRVYERQGKAQNNFALVLPPATSDMAAQIFKDPYLFDMLGTADPRRAAEVAQALVAHVEKFLLELGAGFAFVGRQVPLEVGESDFKVDLLFYHFKLHCFVVVELKAVPFEAAFVGQLNLYLSAADDLLKQPEDSRRSVCASAGARTRRARIRLPRPHAPRGGRGN